MEEYHKINTIFKRDMKNSKKLIVGEWSTPEFEYLANNQWEFTEKVDGTNIRVHFDRVDDLIITSFGGRTNSADIPGPLMTHLNRVFLSHVLKDTVGFMMVERDIDSMTLYGEGYGPKINGGGKYRDDASFVLFDVKIGDWWLSRDNVNDIADKLGIDSVPVIGYGTLHDAVNMVKDDRSVVSAEEFHKVSGPLKSQWGDFEAEGIVARPVVPMFDRKGQRIIAKIKGRDFA